MKEDEVLSEEISDKKTDDISSDENGSVTEEVSEEKIEKDTDVSAQESDETETQKTEKTVQKVTFKKIKAKAVEILAEFGLPDLLLVRLIGVYFFLSGINIISMRKQKIFSVATWQDFVLKTNIPVGIICILLFFGVLTALYYFLPQKFKFFDKLVGIAGVFFFANAVMYRTNTFYMAVGLIFVSVVFLGYILGKTDLSRTEKINPWFVGIPVLFVTVVVATFVIMTVVDHHRIFGTSCFDFGIFAQMFHSMKENFTAVTTCERGSLMSHFKIHASFIYYILLPVYAVFPHEETLLVSQVILALGGIIPTFLIAKNHNYKGVSLFFVCTLYIFCAGIIAPCYYDFHENCFLPTLLMWLLYAVDRKNYVLFYIMSALTCIVKEDAPLYVICISLFFFFNEKKLSRINGLIMTAISGTYFILITKWLTKYGDGKFFASTRFGNLTIDPDAGFGEIVRNTLVDPGYIINLLVKEETIMFFLQVMLPLLFVPLLTKKIHRLLLIIPFVIMNLIVGSGYSYAANIGYQYTFGPECLLIYLFIINCEDLSAEFKRKIPVLAAAASLITVVTVCSGNITYHENYKENKAVYTQMEECLDSVPEDASVGVNTWYLPHIADRDEVYSLGGINVLDDTQTEISSEKCLKYDYIVISPMDEYYAMWTIKLEQLGFTLYNSVDNKMVIYQNPMYLVK